MENDPHIGFLETLGAVFCVGVVIVLGAAFGWWVSGIL